MRVTLKYYYEEHYNIEIFFFNYKHIIYGFKKIIYCIF